MGTKGRRTTETLLGALLIALGSACATASYFPDSQPPSEAEGLLLAERALAAEMAKPLVVARKAPDYLYVRIGDRAAPRSLLRRVPVTAPFRLRPDPFAQPQDGHCVQVTVRQTSRRGEIEVNVIYGHSHPGHITLDHHGTFFIFVKSEGDWKLERRGSWSD